MTLPILSVAIHLLATVGSMPAAAMESSLGVDYPKKASLLLPDCGACREGVATVTIPSTLRSTDDPEDGSDLLLIDSSGNPVPFALARGEAPRDETGLKDRPTSDPSVVSIKATDLPIDGIRVSVPGSSVVGRVTVRDAQTEAVIAGPTLIWTHEVGEHRQVDFAPTTGPLSVEFSWFERVPSRVPRVTGLRTIPPTVPTDRITVPVTHRRLNDDGSVDYTIQLDSPLPIRAIDLGDVDEPVISRTVSVMDARTSSYDDGERLGLGEIRRVRVGEATLDAMTVPLNQLPTGDRLTIRVQSRGNPVLDLETVDVLLEGESIWFQPTGPGPYTLYAGAPANTRPPSELQLAMTELVRLPTTLGVLEGVGNNPRFVPPVLQSGLTEPGRPLPNPDSFSHTASITGETGMVRIPLGPEVQTASRRDLRDLRLTDSSGNQIPHLLRRSGVDPSETVDISGMEAVDAGRVSRLVIPVSNPQVPLATLTLNTDAPVFERRVTMFMPNGAELRPIRAVDWSGSLRPGSVGIAVDQVVGDQLVVEITNGDDPPLALSGATLSRQGWELMAVLPEDGATLHVGDPRRSEADFDLQLYSNDLSSRAVAVATVGPLIEQETPPLAFVDRAALLAGLGVLVLGLAGLTLRLLRSVPDTDASDPPDAERSPADDTDAPIVAVEPIGPASPQFEEPSDA